jgi:hypothetical protein
MTKEFNNKDDSGSEKLAAIFRWIERDYLGSQVGRSTGSNFGTHIHTNYVG